MENQIRIDSAMAMLTEVASISHVFDEDAAELGCGPIHYALDLDDQLYLVWEDDDTKKIVVVPVECWELGNLLEAIVNLLGFLLFRLLIGESFEKVAAG